MKEKNNGSIGLIELFVRQKKTCEKKKYRMIVTMFNKIMLEIIISIQNFDHNITENEILL